METIDTAGITRAVIGLTGFVSGIDSNIAFTSTRLAVPVSNLNDLKERADLLAVEFAKLDLVGSLACVRRIQEILGTASESPRPPQAVGDWASFAPMDSARLKSACQDLNNRLPDELKSRIALTLSAGRAEYFRQSKPAFGQHVQDRFPSLIDEISDAAKCYALGCSTACAFHSIRCLEAGIRALSRCLNIPDPTKASQRNWGNILKDIKAEIDRRWPTATDRLSGDGEFFDNAYAALAAMQNPWRNATMHLDQRYADDSAKHIFDVVHGFMSRLAVRMDEYGLPKA